MSLNSSTDTENLFASALGVRCWSEIKNSGGLDAAQKSADGSEKVFEVIDAAQKLYPVLGKIPDIIETSRDERFRSSITIPLPNSCMVALVSRDSQNGPFFSSSHRDFRWGSNSSPNGIAGLCATIANMVFVPDLHDPGERLAKYWVPPQTGVDGGIIALPIQIMPVASRLADPSCIAVLTVSSEKAGVLKVSHVSCLKQLADEIKETLLTTTILPGNKDGTEKVVDRLPPGSYVPSTGPEKLRFGSYGGETWKKKLANIIRDLAERTRRGKKPTKAIELLELFRAAGNEGITIEQLYPYFEDSDDKERSIVSFISNLNSRYLEGEKVRIEGQVVYRIVPHTESKSSPQK